MLESALTKTGFCSHTQSLIKFHLQKPVPGNVQVLQHQLKLDLALNRDTCRCYFDGEAPDDEGKTFKSSEAAGIGQVAGVNNASGENCSAMSHS